MTEDVSSRGALREKKFSIPAAAGSSPSMPLMVFRPCGLTRVELGLGVRVNPVNSRFLRVEYAERTRLHDIAITNVVGLPHPYRFRTWP